MALTIDQADLGDHADAAGYGGTPATFTNNVAIAANTWIIVAYGWTFTGNVSFTGGGLTWNTVQVSTATTERAAVAYAWNPSAISSGALTIAPAMSNGDHDHRNMAAFSVLGGDASSFDTSSTNASDTGGTTWTGTSLTTASANEMLVCARSGPAGGGTCTSGGTIRAFDEDNATDHRILAISQIEASAGSGKNVSGANSFSGGYAVVIVALKEAAGGAAPAEVPTQERVVPIRLRRYHRRIFGLPFEGLPLDLPPSGLDQTLGIDDTLSLADAMAFDFGEGLADTTSLADAWVFEYGELLADTLSLADATAQDEGKAIDDTVGLADAASIEQGEGLSDSVSVSDSTLIFEQGEGIADSVSTSDSLTYDFSKLIADTVSLSDQANLAREILLSDSVSLSDFDLEEIFKLVNVDDSISLSDAMTFAREILVADSATPTDFLVFVRELVLTDTLGVADLLVSEKGIFITLDDPVSLSDALVFAFGKLIADTISLDDLLTPEETGDSGAKFVEIDDTVVVLDSNARQVNGLFISDGGGTTKGQRIIVIGRF